ncbi:MAG: hypothetical protein SFY81_10910 [Verrucomicrobiota bacterium]|nr:hypothetical protein [Verrucomicrobiota bacterium]
MALSRGKKIIGWGLFLLFLLGCGLAYLSYEIFREVGLEWRDDPNPVEAHEARRKLKLFNDSIAAGRRGWVRLSEHEINSYLDERSRGVNSSTNANDTSTPVYSAIDLTSSNLVYYAYPVKSILGKDFSFVVQQRVSLLRVDGKLIFKPAELKLGHLVVPPPCWEWVEEIVGSFDSGFSQEYSLLDKVPQLEIAQNELTQAPELRLYTYSPTAEPK